jgi:hypothetical protein
MKRLPLLLAASIVSSAIALAGGQTPPAGQAAATGSITGHVKLTGQAPGNPQIRMNMDPKCAQATTGKKIFQMTVVADTNGNLGNAFVSLKGTFPKTAVPTDPVTIDQKDCVFIPRVVGARVGQTLLVKSSDNLGHNAHGQTMKNNAFNVNIANASAPPSKFVLKDEEIMLKITCDAHNWMYAYVGVVSHPYFAVTGTTGAFQIDKVPVGTHSIQVWHERYGLLTKSVTVAAGKPTVVDFAYTGAEPAPRGALENPYDDDGGVSVQLASRLP